MLIAIDSICKEVLYLCSCKEAGLQGENARKNLAKTDSLHWSPRVVSKSKYCLNLLQVVHESLACKCYSALYNRVDLLKQIPLIERISESVSYTTFSRTHITAEPG